jgi:hypothetical protein
MGSATLESPAPAASLREKATDTVRQAAHLSHEAQLLKSMAADAVEDGMYAAKRALKQVRRRVHDVEDLCDKAVYAVKREPIKSVGYAFAGGLAIGAIAGLLLRRKPRTAA